MIFALTTGGTTGGPRLVAYDKATGEELVSVDLPGAAIGTPMTYMLDGRQYVAITVQGATRTLAGTDCALVASVTELKRRKKTQARTKNEKQKTKERTTNDERNIALAPTWRGVEHAVARTGRSHAMLRFELPIPVFRFFVLRFCSSSLVLSFKLNMVSSLSLGCRWLLKRPIVAMSSALCLAVGVAAATVAWALIDAGVIRPFGLRETSRLVVVWESDPARNQPLIEVSLLNFLDWQRQARTVEAMAAFGSQHWPGLGRIGGESVPLALRGVSTASSNTWSGAAARPQLRPVNARAEVLPPVILSHRLWQSRFRGGAVLGQQVFIDGTHHTVIGIMPRGFAYPDDPDAWVSVERVLGEAFQKTPLDQQRQIGVLEVLARRSATVTADAVQAELSAIIQDLQRRHWTSSAPVTVTASVTPFRDAVLGQLGARVWIAVAMGVAVFLLACRQRRRRSFRASQRARQRVPLDSSSDAAPAAAAGPRDRATRACAPRGRHRDDHRDPTRSKYSQAPYAHPRQRYQSESAHAERPGVDCGADTARLDSHGRRARMLASARSPAVSPGAGHRTRLESAESALRSFFGQSATAVVVVALAAIALTTFARLSRIDDGISPPTV